VMPIRFRNASLTQIMVDVSYYAKMFHLITQLNLKPS